MTCNLMQSTRGVQRTTLAVNIVTRPPPPLVMEDLGRRCGVGRRAPSAPPCITHLQPSGCNRALVHTVKSAVHDALGCATRPAHPLAGSWRATPTHIGSPWSTSPRRDSSCCVSVAAPRLLLPALWRRREKGVMLLQALLRRRSRRWRLWGRVGLRRRRRCSGAAGTGFVTVGRDGGVDRANYAWYCCWCPCAIIIAACAWWGW